MSYLFSTKHREYLELYFKMKNRYDFSFTEEEKEKFIQECINFIGYYDIIIYPETSGSILPLLAQKCSNQSFCILKNSKEFIQSQIFSLNLMKSEKISLLNAFSTMNNSFELKKIKGNQRKRFIPFLFQKQDINLENQSVLILDDAIFSSNTIAALLFHYPDFEVKTIFSK